MYYTLYIIMQNNGKAFDEKLFVQINMKYLSKIKGLGREPGV